jgi:membrane-associated phospholipid phosphatase
LQSDWTLADRAELNGVANAPCNSEMNWQMNADQIASFLGQHAIAVLLFGFVLMLGATLLYWNFLDRNAQRFWQAGANAWSKIPNVAPVTHFRERFPWLWNMLGRRFAPESYLGLHFTIAVCVLLIAASCFLMLADEVGEQDSLVEFDRVLSLSLHEHSSLRIVRIFDIITDFGNVLALGCIGLIVIVILGAQRRLQLLGIWVVALLGTAFLNQTLKNIFQRVRPHLMNPWSNEPGWSFPSGHAMGSLVVYGMLAYTVGLTVKSRAIRIGLIFLAVSLVIAVGFSRIYLGAHYFSDVIAGYCAASFWLAICISGNEIARRHRPKF